MKVLIVSSNTLSASPSGPVYVAGAVRQAGHEVQIFERLFTSDLAGELSAKLEDFQPEVVGISIRLVFGDELDPEAPLGTRHTDLRPRVEEIVDIVRQSSPARIVLGGPGFNYYARDWLEYLELDYGIRGEGDLLWGTGDLRPMGVNDDLCRMMEESGCFYANLSIESASEKMLLSMKRGYTVGQVRRSLEALSRSKIPFGASLMLGAPDRIPER